MKHWTVVRDEEYVFELKDKDNVYSKDEFFWWAYVKRDGCVEIHRRFNTPAANDEMNLQSDLHFCGINQAIEMLQEIKAEMEKRGFDVE